MVLRYLFLLSGLSLSAEWAVGGYLGGTRTLENSIHIVQPNLATDVRLRGVQFTGRSFDAPVYYGFRVGFYPWNRVGFEGEFIHLKVYANVDRTIRTEGAVRGALFEEQVPMRQIAGQFSISHGLNMLLGNIVLRHSFGRSRVLASIRLGAGPTIPHPETELFGAFDEHYESGRIAVQGAGGFEVRLWRGLYALAEYKYTWTDQRFRIHQGRASTIAQTHHLIGGVAWHFSP